MGIGSQRPTRRADPCHKGVRCASTGWRTRCRPKFDRKHDLVSQDAFCAPLRLPMAEEAAWTFEGLTARSAMKERNDRGVLHSEKTAKDPRQQRLKRALRENLK